MHLPFWLVTAALAPLLVYQGKRTRQRTPRLPEASGRPFGQYGEGEPAYRVLVVGESTAAGVGVESHDQGLASELARQLHHRDQRPVAWHTFGINGATLAQLTQELASAALPPADLVLLSMGVNDTTALTSRARFRQQLIDLRRLLQSRCPSLQHAPLYLLRVPPMEHFTALPSPLRHVMGWRARQLDALYQELARRYAGDFVHVSYPVITDPGLLARDGYHPSRRGYQTMVSSLLESGQFGA